MHALGSSRRDFQASDDISSKTSAIDVAIGSLFRPKLLFWLEVLSVLRKVGLASGLLLMAGSAVSHLYLPQWIC